MKRRRWKAPNNPTTPARQVWRALWPGEPWPKGWRVVWVGFMRGASGLCDYSTQRILLNHSDGRWGPVLRTLVHEMIHVRHKGLRHGKDFRRIEDSLCLRLGIPPIHS